MGKSVRAALLGDLVGGFLYKVYNMAVKVLLCWMIWLGFLCAEYMIVEICIFVGGSLPFWLGRVQDIVAV